MIPVRELLRPPRPWHLLIAPAIPLLAFLKDSLDVAPPSVIVTPLTLLTMLTIVLAVAIVPLGKERHCSACALTLVLVTALSFITIARGALAFGLGAAPIAGIYAATWLTAIVLFRSTRPAPALTTFANTAAALAVAFLIVPIAWSEWQRPRKVAEPFDLPAAPAASRPDVYIIVLDGYGREDVLREVYSLDRSLAPELRARGFYVADHAAANYSQTALALASALNGDYVQALAPVVRRDMDRRGLGDLIADNRLFRAFAAAGYRTRAYASEYALVGPSAHERPAAWIHPNEFTYAAYETTIVPAVLNAIGLPRSGLPMMLHRHDIDWTLNHLAARLPAGPEPALVFAHLIAPHSPFAFDADGRARHTRLPALLSDGDMWQSIAKGTGESYKNGYADTVRVLNQRLTAVLDRIIVPGRESIVLVHSDHGPGSGLEWESPERTNIRERMGILLAVRFPHAEPPPLAPAATPVNAYRAVLNRALGTNLPALEDRSYHSTWSHPFAFIDTTELMKPRSGAH